MITVLTIKNPFNPYKDRVVERVKIAPGLTVEILARERAADFPGLDLQCVVNGSKASAEHNLQNGDLVVVSPIILKGGGLAKVLGTIAMVALSIYAPQVGAAVDGWLGGVAGTAWSFAAYAATAAVMFLGSYVISRFCSTAIDTGSYSSTSDPTYSWAGPTTMEGQNNAIQCVYGKVKTAGQTIGKFISTLDNKEYLNWLICVGYGPLTISDIKINGNAAAYYEGVTVETRQGLNNQSPISNFMDTYFTKTLGYLLTTSARTDTAQGNATQGVIIKVEFSNGLYYANDDGSLGEAWVILQGQYRPVGGSWQNIIGDGKIITENYKNAWLNSQNVNQGTYHVTITPLQWVYSITVDGYGTVTTADSIISVGPFSWNKSDLTRIFSIEEGNIKVVSGISKVAGNVSNAIRKEWRVDGLTAGEYEVKVWIVSRSHDENNSRACTKCYWSGLTSVVYDDFCYPNKALVGIKALATDQLSGSPSVSFIVERPTIWAWNPTVKAYQEKPANNPAWACYDYVHQCSHLQDINTGEWVFDVRGAAKELMLYDQFEAWASFCEAKNLKINYIDSTVGRLMDKLNQIIAPIGRGYVVWFGTKCGCIWDCVKQPVQMFGMGNIIAGTFKEDFMQTSDRANSIELTYTDAEAGYERQTITVYGDDYDSADATPKTTQISYDGITSYEQAVRTAKYLLYCNKYLVRTVSFDADVDAISCTIGDVVLVSHDVPKWARSGRIYKVDGNTLTLPCEDLVDLTGSYRIMYRTVDDAIHEKDVTINSSQNGWTTVTVPAGFSTDEIPAANDVFDLALVEKGSKPFSVRKISRKQDYTRTIECIEYNSAIYNEQYDIPPINYSDTSYLPVNVQQLQANQVAYKDSNSNVRCKLFASWVLPSGAPACKYTVLLSKDGTNYSVVLSSISRTSIELDTEPNTQYWLKVISVLGVNQSKGIVVGPISKGTDTVPPDVIKMSHELLANDTRRFWWDFMYPNPNDIAGFRLKYMPGGSISWDGALPLHEGLITSQPFETATLRQGTSAILIKAVDYMGQESKNAAIMMIDLGDVLKENILYENDLSSNAWEQVTTDGYVDHDGTLTAEESNAMWSGYDNPMWSGYDNAMWPKVLYKPFAVSYSFTAVVSGQLWIDLILDGKFEVNYTINGSTFPYTQKVKVAAGSVISIKINANGSYDHYRLSKAVVYIDVPDRQEHFEDLSVPVTGLELPVQTPNYYTAAVRIDAVENNAILRTEVVSRQPCVIKLVDTGGNYIAGTVDVTWQGYQKEMI